MVVEDPTSCGVCLRNKNNNNNNNVILKFRLENIWIGYLLGKNLLFIMIEIGSRKNVRNYYLDKLK